MIRVGVRYEMDGTTRQENWALSDDDYNTWRFGLVGLHAGLMSQKPGCLTLHLWTWQGRRTARDPV